MVEEEVSTDIKKSVVVEIEETKVVISNETQNEDSPAEPEEAKSEPLESQTIDQNEVISQNVKEEGLSTIELATVVNGIHSDSGEDPIDSSTASDSRVEDTTNDFDPEDVLAATAGKR